MTKHRWKQNCPSSDYFKLFVTLLLCFPSRKYIQVLLYQYISPMELICFCILFVLEIEIGLSKYIIPTNLLHFKEN